MGTKSSALMWEVIIVTMLLLLVPISIGISQGIMFTPEEETIFEPETSDGFNMTYSYDDGSTQSTSSGLYTINETGDDYHTFITPAENATFDNFVIELDYNISDALDDGMETFYFKGQFPLEGEVDMELYADDGSNTETLDEMTVNVTEDMKTYTFEVETLDLLVAEDEVGEEASIAFTVMNVDNSDSAADGNVLPAEGHTLYFGLEVASSYVRSPLVTLNVLSAFWALILGVFTVFATPYVDLKDLIEVMK